MSNSFMDYLSDRLNETAQEAKGFTRNPNCFGAGYAVGQREAFSEIIEFLVAQLVDNTAQ